MALYYVELVWNREFHFVPYGESESNLKDAIKVAKSLLDMGDGASVKKARVVDENGILRWPLPDKEPDFGGPVFHCMDMDNCE